MTPLIIIAVGLGVLAIYGFGLWIGFRIIRQQNAKIAALQQGRDSHGRFVGRGK